MASFNITVNSKFRPLSYAELMAPVDYYNQEYDKAEEQYNTLSQQTEAFKDVANREKAPDTWAQYNKYSTMLNTAIDDFSKGMTAKNRAALLGLKRDYAKEIIPIANAYARQQAQIKEQNDMDLKDPTHIWERRAADESIDKYLHDPNYNYGRQYSGALITQYVQNAADKLAKEAKNEQGKAKIRQLLPYTYQIVEQDGYTAEAVMKAIQQSPDADEILTGLVENAVDNTGIRDWNNNEALNKAYKAAKQGLYYAIGDSKTHEITDNYGMQLALLQAKNSLPSSSSVSNNKSALNKQMLSNIYEGRIPLNIVPLVGTNDEGNKLKERILLIANRLGIGNGGAGDKAGKHIALAGKNGQHIKLWTDKGVLISKDEFMKQLDGAIIYGTPSSSVTGYKNDTRHEITEAEKQQVYDSYMNDLYELGLDPTNGKITIKDVVNARDNIIKNNVGARIMQGIIIPTYNNAQVFKELNSRIATGEDMLTPFEEVMTFDRNSNVVTSGHRASFADKFNDSGTLSGASSPEFMVLPNMNQNLLMRLDGKTYSVPLNKLVSQSIIDETYGYMGNMLQAKEILNELKQAAQQRYLSLINQGVEPQLAANTAQSELVNSPYYTQIASAIDNNYAAFMRSLQNNLHFRMNEAVYDTNTTSETVIP